MSETWPYKYFTRKELECRCGCGGILQGDFIEKLDKLREQHGKALVVSSGFRCPTHNSRVSSTGLTGPHTTGRAVDFAVRGKDAYELIWLAILSEFTGIGIQQKGAGRFVHLDDLPNAEGQPRPTVWSY